MTNKPTVWQVAAGESNRNYTDLFIDCDVMLLGPGRYGAYNEETHKKMVEIGWTEKKVGCIRKFAEEVKHGDIVLLRNTKKVVSIGLVANEEYSHNDCFRDVLGWDLQHTRRVIWDQHLSGKLEQIQKDKELFWKQNQTPMFTRVNDESVIERVRYLFKDIKQRKLKDMPSNISLQLSLDELGEELFSEGLPNESVEKFIDAVKRQRRLIKWYVEYGKESKRPQEHEVVAHMILPLLLALGWSEQLLAIEWNKIDLAAFWGTPTTNDKCCLVCEAKGLGMGLQKAFSQAKDYTKKHNLDKCKKILLTDGHLLYVHEKINGCWSEQPSGYLNIRNICKNYVFPTGTDAIKTIIALTPAGIGRKIE